MKNIFKSPYALLAAGVILVAASSVGATRAAVVYSGAANQVNFEASTIDVAVQEKVGDKWETITGEDELALASLDADDKIKIGKRYDEQLKVVNDSAGEYDEYIRVTIKKSWGKTNEDGSFTKDTMLDPELIELGFAEGFDSKWLKSESESTQETAVYYLKSPLAFEEEETFLTSITINDKITKLVDKHEESKDEDGYTVITNVYKYNGQELSLEVKVDAVQSHNAVDAIKGTWGVDVTVDEDNTITAIN